jgi:chemotaxis protein histidine kinase CheA
MKKKLRLALLLMTALVLGTSQDLGVLTPASFGNNHVVLADTKTKSKSVKKDDKAIKAAKKAVKKLEKTPTQENLDLANKKVKAVKNKKTKKQLKKRIASVKVAIEAQKQEQAAEAAAEDAVANLEANQTRENVDDAKNMVNAVADSAKKEAFNNRINAVVSAIDAKEAEAARQAEEARKAEEARQAQEQAAAEAARQAQEQAAAAAQQAQQQEQAAGGYKRDYRGRWHRPNGQYASKAEIAAAGLPW